MKISEYMSNKIKQKTNFGIYCLFQLFSFLVILPQFFVKFPNIIDDGQDLLLIHNNSLIKYMLINIDLIDRFRPLFKLFRYIIYQLFGLAMPLHFLVNAIILALVVYLVYIILLKITKSKYISFLLAITVYSLPSLYENLYRLGTDEPIMTLLLLLVIWAFISKKYFFNVAYLILGLFIKETIVLFLFFYSFVYLSMKKYTYFLILLFASLIFIKFVLVPRIFAPVSYFSASTFNVYDGINNFLNYFQTSKISFMVLAGLLFLSFFFRKALVKQNKSWYLLIIGQSIAFLPQFYIWPINSLYYLLPFDILIIIFAGYILSTFMAYKYFKLLMAITIFIFIISQINLCRSSVQRWHQDYIYNGALVAYLINHDLSNINIYSNIDQSEDYYDITIYATHFNNLNSNFNPSIYDWTAPWSKKIADPLIFKKLAIKAMNEFLIHKNSNSLLISNSKIDLGSEFRELPICGKSPFTSYDCRYWIYSYSL